MSINEVCRALGASEKTVRSMVRRRELPALPDTGGQGRRLLFDAQAVSDYASNADLGRILARAALGRMTNRIAESATHYWHRGHHWNPGHTEHGTRPVWGLEYFGVFPDLPPGHRLIKHDPLPHMPPYYSGTTINPGTKNERIISYDDLLSRAGNIAGKLTRRECEYLIASLICAAYPAASQRGKSSKAEKISFTVSGRRWAERVAKAKARGISPLPAMVLFFERVPAIVFARSPEEKAIVSDYDLLTVLFTAPKQRKYRAQVRRICNILGISLNQLEQAAERKYRINIIGLGIPPASAVGRIMNMKRAQAAALWRSIQSKLAGPDLDWFVSLKPLA